MEPITEQELRAFVGRNANYYLRKFWPALKTRGPGYDNVAIAGLMVKQPKTGFNWVAFFLSGLWLPYRKMYLPTLLLFGVVLIESVLEEVVFVGILGKPEPPHDLARLVGFAVAIVCGCFGNQWYLYRARKVIADVRSQGLSAEEHLRELSKRGGTSLPAPLGLFAVSVVALVAVVLASDRIVRAG
jgi:hypothetical protein